MPCYLPLFCISQSVPWLHPMCSATMTTYCRIWQEVMSQEEEEDLHSYTHVCRQRPLLLYLYSLLLRYVFVWSWSRVQHYECLNEWSSHSVSIFNDLLVKQQLFTFHLSHLMTLKYGGSLNTSWQKSWKDQENTLSRGCDIKCFWNWTGNAFRDCIDSLGTYH